MKGFTMNIIIVIFNYIVFFIKQYRIQRNRSDIQPQHYFPSIRTEMFRIICHNPLFINCLTPE